MERNWLFRHGRHLEAAVASVVFGYRGAVLHILAGLAVDHLLDEGSNRATSGCAAPGFLLNQRLAVNYQYRRRLLSTRPTFLGIVGGGGIGVPKPNRSCV